MHSSEVGAIVRDYPLPDRLQWGRQGAVETESGRWGELITLEPGAWGERGSFCVGDGETMDVINTFFNSLMYETSTLVGAIILVAALAYVGTNVISPSNIELRRLVGYLSSIALVVIGAGGFLFGASKELTLLLSKVYVFDAFRIEWMFVGALAIAVGLLLARQSLRRL